MPEIPDREGLNVPNSQPPNRPLRADGSLSYLEFIRLVNKLWSDAIGTREDGVTPRVPIYATGTALNDPDYPCILYTLEARKPFENEPKPRIREIINEENRSVLITAQRFENYIRFTALDRVPPAGAHRVEEIIEAFEDFMLEHTPIFKRCGLSDMFYMQRRTDDMDDRDSFSIVKRSVSYLIITEKIFQSDVWQMREVLINARTYIANNQIEQATPSYEGVSIEIDDQFASPNF